MGPLPGAGASATSAGLKEGVKGIFSGSAGNLCALLVLGIPILLTCLGMDEGDEPWAPHTKPGCSRSGGAGVTQVEEFPGSEGAAASWFEEFPVLVAAQPSPFPFSP